MKTPEQKLFSVNKFRSIRRIVSVSSSLALTRFLTRLKNFNNFTYFWFVQSICGQIIHAFEMVFNLWDAISARSRNFNPEKNWTKKNYLRNKRKSLEFYFFFRSTEKRMSEMQKKERTKVSEAVNSSEK